MLRGPFLSYEGLLVHMDGTSCLCGITYTYVEVFLVGGAYSTHMLR